MAKGLSEVCSGTLSYFMKGLNMAKRAGAEKRYIEMIASGAVKEKGFAQLAVDGTAEVSVNGLLSGTGTALINVISGVVQAVLMPTVRLTQGLITADAKVVGESLSMFAGAIQGFQDFIPHMARGWARGMPLDLDITDPRNLGMNKKEYREFLMNMGLDENAPPEKILETMGDAYDYMNQTFRGPLGDLIRIPTRVIVAIDEGMKAVFRRQKYNAFAFNKALENTNNGRTGSTYEELLRLTNVNLSDPKKAELAWRNVKAKDDDSIGELSALYAAQDYAKLNAFQQRLFGAARQAQKARAEVKPLVLAIPFLKTPYNILKEGLTFVPGVGYVTGKFYKRATNVVEKGMKSKEVREGATRLENSEIAARQLLGMGAVMTTFQLMEEDLITGKLPENPAEREAWRANKIPEYSIRVGDTWISYRKVEPLATVFGLASDASRLYDDYLENAEDPTVEEFEKLTGGIYASLIDNVMGKSFMEGLSNVVNLLAGGANYATGGGTAQLDQFATNLGRVVIPYGALLNSIAISMDSEFAPDGKRWDRQATSVIEKLEQRIPTLRESLPLMYGIYGEERKLNIMDVWTGIKTVQESDRTTLQQELASLGVAYAPINRSLKEDLRLNNAELGELRQIAAETITPMLETMLQSKVFQAMPESQKNIYFEKVMRTGRSRSTKVFVARHIADPAFQARYHNALIKNKGLQDLMGFYTVPQ